MELRRFEDFGFLLPVPICIILSHSGIDVQSRAVAATGFPSVAVDEIRAMAGEGPCVAEIEDDWRDFGEFRQNAQIEIPSMEIVAMDDIRLFPNDLRKLIAAGECPFVSTIPPIGKA